MNDRIMKLITEDQQLEELVQERTRELNHSLDMAIYCMASLAETRDTETGYHVRRTQEYVRILAEKLQEHAEFSEYLTVQRIELMYKASPLHDIGKVAIPDHILLKQGPLNRTEWDEMKRHTVYGRSALDQAEREFGPSEFLQLARTIAYSHHERWDGKGYPEALLGEEIPIPGRIMALADVYDTLISKRVYKSACSHQEAVEKIRAERGAHFDPQVADAFLACKEMFLEVARRYGDEYTSV